MSSQYPRSMSLGDLEQPKRRTFRALLMRIRAGLTTSLPVWVTILVMLVLGTATIVFSRQANQSAIAQDATTVLLHQQQIAAAYVPTIAQCKSYAPSVDGPDGVTISLAPAGSRLCSASMTLSPDKLPSDEASIASPGGMAFVDYTETNADGSSAGSMTIAMDATEATVRSIQSTSGLTYSPWEITIYYLPSIAPKGADAGFGQRSLAAYAASHSVDMLRSSDVRLELPTGVYRSPEDILQPGLKG